VASLPREKFPVLHFQKCAQCHVSWGNNNSLTGGVMTMEAVMWYSANTVLVTHSRQKTC
jgi:hypothetical protein